MAIEERTLEQLRSYFAAQPVKQALLFGSFARGVADAQSDMD